MNSASAPRGRFSGFRPAGEYGGLEAAIGLCLFTGHASIPSRGCFGTDGNSDSSGSGASTPVAGEIVDLIVVVTLMARVGVCTSSAALARGSAAVVFDAGE